MAKACSNGAIHHCSCAGTPKETPTSDFHWGGCGDNIRWGMHFTKRFVDIIEKYNAKIETDDAVKQSNLLTEHDRRHFKLRSFIAIVNLHNNKVGRKVKK